MPHRKNKRIDSFKRDKTMNHLHRRSWSLALAMILAASLAVYAKPSYRLVDSNARVELAQMVPSQFGEWRLDEGIVPIQPAPDVQAQLDNLYDQTFAATFLNSKGDRVMLSLAYGKEQTKSSSIHRPEVCYPAQGFLIQKQYEGQISTDFGAINMRRIVAVQNGRVEPVTYWIRVGDMLVNGSVAQKMAAIRYGLKGEIADGLLFRMSSISPDVNEGFLLQERFARDLLSSIDNSKRKFLFGQFPEGAGKP